MDNRCVCCGDVIPEGMQVCRKCQREDDTPENVTPRLIDANQYIRWLGRLASDPEASDIADFLIALKTMFEKAPVVNARIIVDAQWILSDDGSAECSNCGADGALFMDFCPRCGASMFRKRSEVDAV